MVRLIPHARKIQRTEVKPPNQPQLTHFRHSLDSNGLAYFEGVEILEKLDFQDFIKRLLKGFQTAIKALTSITETLQTKLEAKQADLLSQNRTSFPEFAQIYNTHTRETTLRPNSRIGSGTLPDRFASIESKPAGGLGFIKSSTKGKTTNNSSSQCYQYSPNSGEMGSREKVVVSDLTCFKEPGEDRDGHHIFLQNMSTQQSRHPHHHNGPGGPSLSHVGMSRRVRRSERTRSAQEMTAGGHLTVREQLGARNAGRRASTSFRVDEEEKRPRTGPQGHHVFDRKEELVENIKQLRKRIEEKDVDFIAKNWKQKLLLESRKNSSSIHSVHLHNGSRTFSEGSDGGPSSNKKLAGLVLDSKGEKYEKFGGAKQFNLHGEPSVVAPAGKNRGLHNLLCSFNIQEDSRHLTSTIDKFMYRTLEKSSILDYSDTKLMDSAGVKPRQLNTARSGREDSSKHNNGRNLIVEQEGMILEEDDEKVSHCFLVEPRKLIGGAQNLSKKFKNVGSRSSSMKRRRSSKADLELIERYLNGHGTQKMRFGPQNGQNVDHGTQVYIRQIEYQDEVSEGSSAQNSKILNQEHFRISDYEVSSMKKNKRRRNSKFEKSTQKSHKKRVNYVEEYRDEEKSENIPPEEDFLPQRRSKQPNFEPQSEDTRFQKKRSGKRLYVSKTRNEMPKGSFRSHLPHKNTRSRKSFTKRSQHSEPKKGNIYSCKQYSGPGVSSSQYSRTDSRSRKHSQAQNGQNTEKDQSSQYSIKMPLKSEQGYQTLQQNSQLTKTDHFNNAIKIQDRFLKTSARKAAHCSRSPKEISKVFLGSATSYQDPRGVNEAPGGLSSHRIPSSYSLKQGRGHKGYIEQNITKPIFRTLDGNGKSGKRRGDDSGTRSCLSKGNLSDFRHRNISGKKEEFDGDGSVDGANEGDSSPYHVSVSSRNGFVRKIKAKSVISKKSKKSAKKEKLSSRDSRSRSHKKLGSHRKLSGSKRTMMDSRKHKSCSRVKLEKETLNGPQTGTNLSKRASADKDSRLIPFGKPSLRQLSKKRVIEDNSVDVSKEASSGDSEGLDGYQDLKLDTEETRGVVYQSNRRPRKIKSVGYLSVRTADGGHLNTDHASEYDLERTLVPEKGGNNPGGSFIEIQSMYRKTEEASMNETKRMLY